jgi:D-glycerate 3-kinase
VITPAPDLLDPLLARIAAWRAGHQGLFVLGICGAQGSGKSTLVAALMARLAAEGVRVAALSLDDLYRTHAERQRLAREVHPLLATRGVPGTHDVALGLGALDAVARGEAAPLPRFDKAFDDRQPPAGWPCAPAGTQVLLLDGWCLGARAQDDAALARPINALEADEDAQGRWRGYANTALAGDYQQLFERVDRLVLLAAPGWDVVARWREQQEADLRERAPGGARVMSPAQVARFIQHYERLTRHILTEMPPRADLVIRLGPEREVLGIVSGG